MARYVKEKIVTECFHGCQFFGTNGHIMECKHPDFDSKDWKSKLIISHDNSKGRVPDECPLRQGATEVVLRIKLKK